MNYHLSEIFLDFFKLSLIAISKAKLIFAKLPENEEFFLSAEALRKPLSWPRSTKCVRAVMTCGCGCESELPDCHRDRTKHILLKKTKSGRIAENQLPDL